MIIITMMQALERRISEHPLLLTEMMLPYIEKRSHFSRDQKATIERAHCTKMERIDSARGTCDGIS
jgi:hypothetical protein